MSAIEVRVPNVGDFHDIPVIEVLVQAGDTVKKDDPLLTLESDKATMEIPSPAAGVVSAIAVKVGDKVSEGTVVLTLDPAADAVPPAGAASDAAATGQPPTPAESAASEPAAVPNAGAQEPAQRQPAAPESVPPPPERPPANHLASGPESHPIAPPARPDEAGFQKAHASPGVRAFARQLGVDLARVQGSGPKERILREDIQDFVKQSLAGAESAPGAAGAGLAAGGVLNLLPWPQIDFEKFGAIERRPLSRIKKISGANLARNWVMIPHVTHHDDADITALEELRVAANAENAKAGVKVTMLAFLIKAAVAALQKFPDFNAALDGDNLILKKYFHIGFAADTPNGLVVPVIRNADAKGVVEIATELAALSARARDGKLGPADMQGGCFSISSLGGIGGTHFTPIINAPEVAILGVCRSQMKPVWDGARFAPRLILPLSLSYDHRVIDGAAAARFAAYLGSILADFRRVLL
ncbi:MAG: dihydrolipoyllysine-residue acetyltransferase [Betaproteobacteria bacterium]